MNIKRKALLITAAVVCSFCVFLYMVAVFPEVAFAIFFAIVGLLGLYYLYKVVLLILEDNV